MVKNVLLAGVLATLCRKNWGPQRKDFGGGFGFPGFYRVFVSTTGLESFSSRPEKFSKRFSFGGGCVRFFSSLHFEPILGPNHPKMGVCGPFWAFKVDKPCK